MKDITRDSSLVFSAGTVAVFVIAAIAGWGFWRVVQVINQAGPRRSRRFNVRRSGALKNIHITGLHTSRPRLGTPAKS